MTRYCFIRFYFAAICIAICSQLLCQSTWIKTINNDLYDNSNGLIHGDSTSFYVMYRSEVGGSTPVTQNLSKYSVDGMEIWSLEFNNPQYNVYQGTAAQITGGDLIISYLFEDSSKLEYRIFRITPNGDIVWTVRFPRILSLEIDYGFEIYKIIEFSPNDIRLYFWMNYHWEFDPPSAKNGFITLDSLGTETYRQYFDTAGEYQHPYNIVQYRDSNFLKVYRPTLGALELLLRYELMDKDYNSLWSFEMGPQDNGNGGPACFDSVGNVYFTWTYDTTGNGSTFFQLPSIVSLDSQGGFRWIRHFGEDRGFAVLYDIISTKDGRIIACGQEGNTQLSNGKQSTGWIICVDTNGNTLWERRYVLEETSDGGNNFGYVIESLDEELIFFGNVYNLGRADVYILKTDYFGCLNADCGLYNFVSLKTDTEEISKEEIDLFYHFNNNSILTLVNTETFSYYDYNYEIVNLNGNVLSSGQTGSEITEIDISKLYSGIYFIRIYNQSNGYSIKKFFKF